MEEGATSTGEFGSQFDLVMGCRTTEKPSSPARGEYESTTKPDFGIEDISGRALSSAWSVAVKRTGLLLHVLSAVLLENGG
jgi:hypothetical protein